MAAAESARPDLGLWYHEIYECTHKLKRYFLQTFYNLSGANAEANRVTLMAFGQTLLSCAFSP